MSDPLAETNPAIIAADTSNMQGGGIGSMFENSGNFWGSAVTSGALSIYNTAAHYIGAEKYDIAETIAKNDSEMGAYYLQNKASADLAGFVVGSIIPGAIGIKGLQLLKAGTALGPFSRALGYAESRQAFYVEAGLKEIGVAGGTVFNTINTNKLAAMAWGVGDNIITMAAMETAIAATMKQSPLLEKDEWSDIFVHGMKTSAVFGTIGGGIGAIGINALFRTTVKDVSKAMNEFTNIERFQGALTEGDKAYGLLASSLRLPQVGKNLDYEYSLNGIERTVTLATADAMEKAAVGAEKAARLEVENLMTKMADGDVAIGQGFSKAVFRIIDDGRKKGTSIEDITDQLGDYLFNVGQLRRIGKDAATAEQDIFYTATKLPAGANPTNTSDLLAAMMSRAPTEGAKGPFKLVGDRTKVKIGLVADEYLTATSWFDRFGAVEDAWAGGMDAIVLANGSIRINPKSKMFKAVEDPAIGASSFFNTRTGAWTQTAYPTIADLSTHARPVSIVGDRLDVVAGNLPAMRMKLMDDFALGSRDTIEASARYAWAGAKKDGEYLFKVVPHTISETDLPLLERIYQQGAGEWKEVRLSIAGGGHTAVEDIGDFASYLMTRKIEMLQGFLARTPAGEDITSLAIKLNAEPTWVQKVIERNFIPDGSLLEGMSIPLEESLRPQNLRVVWDYGAALRATVSTLPPDERVKVLEKLTKEVKDKGLIQKNMFDADQMLPLSANNTVGGQLGYSLRVKVAKDQYEAAFAAVLGAEDAAKFLDISPDIARAIADQTGAGAGFLKFSNADYGDPLRLWSQYSGQQVHLLGQKWANTALETLQPYAAKIFADKSAAGELGVLTNVLRRNADRFYFDVTNPQRIINKEAAKWDKDLGGFVLDETKATSLEAAGRTIKYEIGNADVADFLTTSTALNAARIDKQKVLMTSRGFNYNYDAKAIYIPPVDTGRYPFFAFVRQREGFLGGSSEVSMITARNAAELKTLASKVPEEYEVLFKDNIDAFKKAKGQYDYALSIKEPTVDASLQRRGVLGDFFPEVRAENVLEDWINWHQKQEVGLVRNAVQTKYAQVIEELRATGAQYGEIGTSKVSGILKMFRSQVENPFDDYIKTALDISKRSEYTLLHEANEFVEALGKSAYRNFAANFAAAKSKTISWQEANAISERYGIKGPYSESTLEAFATANSVADRSLIKEFVAKANMLLVNFNLRLDFANSLVNIISTPILLGTEMKSIRDLVAKDSTLTGKLNELRTISLPGSNGAVGVPSTTKLIAESIADFFGAEKDQLIARYKGIGAIKDVASQYHEMMEMLTIKPLSAPNKWVEGANNAIEKSATFTGSNFAEEFTRFISARVMHKLTDPIVGAGKMSVAEQDAFMSVFVNRVQGNYLASQRPIAFQGVLGSAVSLFQTYQFNLLQQLFRHVENKNAAAVAVMGGLQGSVYGLNGIPFFEAVNSHLIANSNLNPGNKDLYSAIPKAMGTELGNWMMYGTASAFPLWGSQSPSLYTRGDINPRHITIIPVTPLDVPAVDGSIRFVSNLLGVGEKIMKGGAVSTSLLEGLEHNSINRPLAGAAQVLQGYATTSKGSLISQANDVFSISTLSRVGGAKPVTESIALNEYFRLNAQKAIDHDKMEAIGEAVKTKLRNNQPLTEQEMRKFQLDTAKAGMRPEQYAEALQRWSKGANTSIINDLTKHNKSSYGQRMQEVMGAEKMQDFRNMALPKFSAPPTANAASVLSNPQAGSQLPAVGAPEPAAPGTASSPSQLPVVSTE